MEFTLIYKGNLLTKESTKLKHDIRIELSKQLKALLKLPPLKKHPEWFKYPYSSELHKEVSGHHFLCLASSKLNMYVKLKIQIFSCYPNRSFKDIDNKLKIIFDSLQIPREQKNIPLKWESKSPNEPIICLVSDDRLVYEIDVKTDYILEKDFFNNGEELLILIKVKIKGNVHNKTYKDLVV